MALVRIGPAAAAAAIPRLIPLCSDPVREVRVAAYTALEGFGTLARAALPTLVQRLREEEKEDRFHAASAIDSIGLEDDTYSPQLEAAMDDGDETVIDFLYRAMTKLQEKTGG